MLTVKKYDKITLSDILPSFRENEKDCGSPAVQIIQATERIINLTEHLKHHPKDNSTKRGLLILVANRKKHLKYLKKHNSEQHKKLIEVLCLK